jgi:integrase
MTQVELPYVNAQRARDGRVRYWYFRRAGRRWRLQGEPMSPEFMSEYHRLLAATGPARPGREQGPGSFGAVVTDYLASPEFNGKRPSTQKIYRLVLEPLAEKHGTNPVALLERRHIKDWRNARSKTPGMANMIVSVVRALLKYAVEEGYRPDNPASKIGAFKLGEHRAWTDEECVAFEARWPSGTMQRRAYMLARYTGQRCADLSVMTRAHCKSGAIRVMQQKTTDGKTNEEIWIPLHRDLAAELALGGGGSVVPLPLTSLLTRRDGSAFDSNSLSMWFAAAIDQAGLTAECKMHGLRKTAAKTLAEVGCTAHEIMAVTGHKSLKEVQRYTKAADQKRLAAAAIRRLERNGN